MRKTKRALTLMMATTVATGALSGLAACGGMDAEQKKNLSDSTILNICMPDLGYGTDWMTAVAKGFTAKTGTKVNVQVTPTESGYVTAMQADNAPYDIYVLRGNTYSMVTSNAANLTGEESYIACYDDLYNSQVGNETKADGTPLTFKEKMKDVYEIYNRVDAKGNGDYHYYAVQWCDSVFSLVRNMDVWKEEWAVPKTTDELLELSKTIKNTKGGYTPFIWSSQASYWWSVANLWVTQYQGLDDMYGEKGFWSGYSEKGVANDPKMWQRQGLLEAMKVLDELVKQENGYQHILSTSVDFTTAQGYFCIPENKIAMMANGDWLYNEMKENYPKANLEMIKTPVLSSIINLPECQDTVQDKTDDGIKDDKELSALIAAIDAGSTALTGEGYHVSQAAYDKVYEARMMYTCSSNINHVMVSPVHSDSLDIVKEFYLYLASEEGQSKFAGSVGLTHCFELTDAVEEASDAASNSFVKSTEKIKRGAQVAPWPVYQSRLFSHGNMPVYPTIEMGYNFPELIFSLEGKGYKNAEQVWSENYRNAVEKWSSYKLAAGLE